MLRDVEAAIKLLDNRFTDGGEIISFAIPQERFLEIISARG
jgi:hypothetical protein